MREAVIIDGVRTPIGRAGRRGVFKGITHSELMVPIIKEILKRNNLDPKDIDEFHVGSAGLVTPMSKCRQYLFEAGFGDNIWGSDVNTQCASGLHTTVESCERVMAGSADIILAAGVETMGRPGVTSPEEMAGQKGGGMAALLMPPKSDTAVPAGVERRGAPDPVVRGQEPADLQHALDSRERPRALRHHPPGSGRVGAAQPAARRRRRRTTAASTTRSCRSPSTTRTAAARRSARTRARAARPTWRRCRQLAARLQGGRLRHRRQLLPPERRRHHLPRHDEGDRQGAGLEADADLPRTPPPSAPTPTSWASGRAGRPRSCSSAPA